MKYNLINKRRQEFLLLQKEILRELNFKHIINIFPIWDKLEDQILESFKKTIIMLNQEYICKKELGDVLGLNLYIVFDYLFKSS